VLRVKVVFFCGGYGMRMRDGTSDRPKPMVPGRLSAYPYSGFWYPADTVKGRVALEAMCQAGRTPWRPDVSRTVPAVLGSAAH
jgi:NDP-sugar pyrophosphorylase family protein